MLNSILSSPSLTTWPPRESFQEKVFYAIRAASSPISLPSGIERLDYWKNSTQSCQSSSIDNVRVLYAHCWFYSCSSDISNWWLFCLFSDFLNNFKNQVGRETFSLLTHFVDIFCRSKSSMHMFITKIYHVKVILWINKVINKLQVG